MEENSRWSGFRNLQLENAVLAFEYSNFAGLNWTYSEYQEFRWGGPFWPAVSMGLYRTNLYRPQVSIAITAHRIYMAVSLSVSGNLLLPQCFHLTWKRKTWLPFHLFTLIVACGHDRKVRLSIAVFSPAIDYLLPGISSVTILPLLRYSPDVAWCLFISNMKKGNLWSMRNTKWPWMIPSC